MKRIHLQAAFLAEQLTLCSERHDGFQLLLQSHLILTTHLKSLLIPEKQNDIIYQLFPPPPAPPPCILVMLQNISDSHSNVYLTLTLHIILLSLVQFSQYPFWGHLISIFYATQCQEIQMVTGFEPMNQKRVSHHSFCKTRLFVSPHYDHGLISLASELCKMVRWLSFNDKNR